MDTRKILESLKSGKISVEAAARMLSIHSIEEIGTFAKIDINRRQRRGVPEVIFAESKSLTHTKEIIARVLAQSSSLVVSRIPDCHRQEIIMLAKDLGASVRSGSGSSALLLHMGPLHMSYGTVGILAAGTSDIGIAEEAKLMCEAMNCRCITEYDVGVAGIQRVFPALEKMVDADIDCMIVVAGMEGALATLVASLVDVPIIGVPTSVGYGHGGNGEAALSAMLQSCSLGVSVVNIDNGIAAGGMAASIANRASRGARSRNAS